MRLKLFSKILSVTLCTVPLAGCISEEYFTPLPSESQPTETVSVDTLYDEILKNLLNKEEASNFDGYVDADDVGKAVARIHNDYPEIFWINGYVTATAESGSKIDSTVTIDVLNDYTPNKLEAMSEELEAAAKKLVNKIPAGLNDFEKIVFVHDNIILNTVYDKDGADAKSNGIWGTAYGCLVNGKAVCQGYSEGFEYIMKLLDIPCGTIKGLAWNNGLNQGNGEPQSHAWNYVTINGKNYWIDLTWDDPDDDEVAGSPLLHTYCLIDDERLKRTRSIDAGQENVPTCYSMDDNYFVRNGSYVTLYSSKGIGQILESSANSDEFEMMFADKNTYNEALDALFNQSELWELSDYAYVSNEVSYTVDDNMYTLKISNK